MKSIKLIIIALLLVPVMGMAQQTPADVAKKQTEWMQQNLDLTEEQLAEVEEINQKYADKRQKVYASTEAKDAKMSDLTETRKEHTEELREVLTPEQFAKFQETEKKWFEDAKSKIGDTEE